MKSTADELRNRGLATGEDIAALADASFTALVQALHGPEPCGRSAAAVCLRTAVDQAADQLLLQLAEERCLYTRLAICESLEAGNIETAGKMAKYLGHIGHNQHKALPQKVSAKKSFPLPRDIISRSLGRMDAAVFPALAEVLDSGDKAQVSEGLDAVGYMTFYQPILATAENRGRVFSTADRFPGDALLLWKVLLCLSAFPGAESKSFLKQFAADATVLGLEARRSLRILESR